MRKKQWKIVHKPRSYVFVEWETEQCYFSVVSSLFRISIECEKVHLLKKTKQGIINKAKALIEKTGNNYSDIKKYQIWIYYILDSDLYAKSEIDCIRSNMFKYGIRVLFSNKDIETFIHAHIKYSTSNSCDYKKEIQKKYPKYDKGNSIYLQQIHEQIIWGSSWTWIIMLKKNMENLKKHHKNSIHDISIMNPYSEVVELVNELLPHLK